MRRIVLAACLTGLALATSAQSAPATVTIGSSLTGTPNLGVGCAPRPCSFSQTALPGRMVTSPVNGTVIRWRVHIYSAGPVRFRVLRPTAAGVHFPHSGPNQSLAAGLHTLPVSLPISIGDRIGMQILVGGDAFLGARGPSANPVPGAAHDFWHSSAGGPPDGATVPPTHQETQTELLLNADVEPTNQFNILGVARNKKNGTATVTAQLPNAGELTASGNGVEVASQAATSVAVTAPGTAQLVIRAQGKKRKKLKRNRKVKVSPTVTFTPTNGTAFSQTTQLMLKKKLKKKLKSKR